MRRVLPDGGARVTVVFALCKVLLVMGAPVAIPVGLARAVTTHDGYRPITSSTFGNLSGRKR